MRKYLPPFILLSLFLQSPSLEARDFFLKMSFGLVHGGKIQDTWEQTESYYGLISTPGKRPRLGMDASLEFIFELKRGICLSFGTGYISRILQGNTIRITHPEMINFQGDVFFSPEFRASIYPFCLTAFFSLPVLTSLRWNFLGGVGYYLSKVECIETNWKFEFPEEGINWNYYLWRYESHSSSVGFHGGTGVDIHLPMGAFLSLEVLYRALEFKRFRTSALKIYQWLQEEGDSHGGDTTFIYLKAIGVSEGKPDIDYMVSNMNCSGFSFRAGLKFKF